MKKAIFASVVAILLLSSFSTIVLANPSDNQAAVSDFSSEQILVKFKPGTSLPQAAEIHRQLGGQAKETIPGIGVQVVTVPKGQAMEKAKAYSSNARVAYAEPDFVAEALGSPDDQYFGLQWGLTKVEASHAWEVTTGSPSINIAILDTGVDADHPDLIDKIVDNVNFSDSPTADDVYGHGTHVAGISAASTNNGMGVAGLGYDSSIMNVKVLRDNGSGYHSWIAAGIIWAADNGAEVINLSLGGGDSSQVLEDAVNYAWSKGAVVVAAAGNNGNSYTVYPAAYVNCIAVGATDAKDARPSWSNYGDWVDVAAPGSGIYSTLKGDSYGYKAGTSMASPHVAGLAALVFAIVTDVNGNGYLNDEVRSKIESTCDDIGVEGIGSGRINAAGAVGGVPLVPGTISGQVTDAGGGSPVYAVLVSDGTRHDFTDPSGKYAIDGVPPGDYQVVASKSGYESSALIVTVLEETTTIVDFSLSEIVVPGTITGTVADAEDGSPIVGAEVTAGARTTTTDASGEYAIADVPPGTYEVTAGKSGYESSSLTVTVLEEATVVADFALNEVIVFGTITGSVTDTEDGLPIASATVTDGTRTVLTDATGQYTINDVPPGSYEVTASKEGYESLTSSVTVISGATSVMNFSLNRKAPVANAMWVDSIGFVEKGKNLFMEVMVVTASEALSGAEVGLSLECSNGEVWNFNGTTNNNGLGRFKLGKAPIGSYLTTINSLTCSGFTWDTSKGITSAGYAVSR